MHSTKIRIIFVAMKEEKNISQMRRGVLEMCVLSLISDSSMYSGDLLKSLKEERLLVVEGTIYPLLNRLKDESLLTYTWEESNEGPPRKYFSITQAGRNYLDELSMSWSELSSAVNKIVNKAKK